MRRLIAAVLLVVLTSSCTAASDSMPAIRLQGPVREAQAMTDQDVLVSIAKSADPSLAGMWQITIVYENGERASFIAVGGYSWADGVLAYADETGALHRLYPGAAISLEAVRIH